MSLPREIRSTFTNTTLLLLVALLALRLPMPWGGVLAAIAGVVGLYWVMQCCRAVRKYRNLSTPKEEISQHDRYYYYGLSALLLCFIIEKIPGITGIILAIPFLVIAIIFGLKLLRLQLRQE